MPPDSSLARRAWRRCQNARTGRPHRCARRPASKADRRVEPAVHVIAVETLVAAQRIGQTDLGDVEAAAEGDREPRRQIESVRRVDPGIERLRERADGGDIAGRLVDIDAYALHDWPLIGIDGSQLARGVELDAAVVDARADDEAVVVTEA